MTESNMPSHPDELLEAFALDALEDDEHLHVEQHLDSCDRCWGYVAGTFGITRPKQRSLSPQQRKDQELRDEWMSRSPR